MHALCEIANWSIKYNVVKVPVTWVSFNNFSPIRPEEQLDPLQALLKQIAFAAWKPQNGADGGCTSELQEEFLSKDCATLLDTIETWLGSSPASLLIDELNNLNHLCDDTKSAVKTAALFGLFLKDYFCKCSGRYFVFSSHIISFIECIGDFLCPELASEGCTALQELPIIQTFAEAKQLKSDLKGAREAVFYGCLPGLIHVHGSIPLQEGMVNKPWIGLEKKLEKRVVYQDSQVSGNWTT